MYIRRICLDYYEFIHFVYYSSLPIHFLYICHSTLLVHGLWYYVGFFFVFLTLDY